MHIIIRQYCHDDIPSMTQIWNDVVNEANAFPQIDTLNESSSQDFFASQSFTAVAELNGEIVGMYILHPNNIGRCGHIANSSYAVKKSMRGKHIGRKLVEHSLKKGHELGFRLLQFNAVVKSNAGAIGLYEKLGFVRLGVIPGGFWRGDDIYEDIVLFYHRL